MYKILYLPVAEDDILKALTYIADKLAMPEAAADLLDSLDKTIENISQFPYSYELYKTDRPLTVEIRKAPVKNFVIFYTVKESVVEIMRFLHGRQNRITKI